MEQQNATTPETYTQNPTDPTAVPAPNTPEYVAFMTAKAEGKAYTPATPTENSGEESLLAGKYKTEADLEQGLVNLLKMKNGGDLESLYKTLEKGGTPTPAENPEGTTDKEAGDSTPETSDGQAKEEGETQEEDARETAEGLGLDFDALTNEVLTNDGDLKPETYAELEKKGLPKEVVAAYIEGQKLVAERIQSDIYTCAGGSAETWEATTAWAAQNLDRSEIEAVNKMLAERPGATETKLAVQGIYTRYKAATGTPAALLNGDGGPSNRPTTDVYDGWGEAHVDMRNPRYNSDPDFQRKVVQKIARSRKLHKS